MDNQNQNMSDTIENISKLNYINEMGEYPKLAGLVRANSERIASEGLAWLLHHMWIMKEWKWWCNEKRLHHLFILHHNNNNQKQFILSARWFDFISFYDEIIINSEICKKAEKLYKRKI